MSEARSIAPARARYLPWLVLGFTIAILGGAIAFTGLHLRRAMRQQIIQQDGIALYVSSFVQDSLLEGLGPEIMSDPELRFADVAAQVFETAHRRGALAVRIFDASGQLQLALPVPAAPRALSAEEREAAAQQKPLSSFDPAAEMADFDAKGGSGPVIRALVPLPSENVPLGSAEFILDGQKVAEALHALDRDLWRYSLVIFLVTGGLISASLVIAYRRLRRTNELLAERTQSLLRANHELTLAAKTSALGAITAHLIHDLKSPLFGLQSFVRARATPEDQDWEIAIDTTERMQKMIADVVRIMQEESTHEGYSLSVEEILDLLRAKAGPEAGSFGVEVQMIGRIEESLDNRTGSIVLLILTNLVHNGLQAAGRGGRLSVHAERRQGEAIFEVTDSGPGLPKHIQDTLFTPCRSGKKGGTGLGLAISKQLANHLGAELLLKETGPKGTTFELRLPERVLNPELLTL